MASGELNSHYYAKILAIIRNQNLQNSKQTISQKNFWPQRTRQKIDAETLAFYL